MTDVCKATGLGTCETLLPSLKVYVLFLGPDCIRCAPCQPCELALLEVSTFCRLLIILGYFHARVTSSGRS